jgi:Histidine kinase-, DNA gyrase B-, and HSP90-like ATPase/Heme oxygenase
MNVFVAPEVEKRAVTQTVLLNPAQPSVLTRLRLETRGEHDAVERVLDLMDASLTRDAYCKRLAQFYGFYHPLEAALHTHCALHLTTLLSRLNKTALLRQDLQQLGIGIAPRHFDQVFKMFKRLHGLEEYGGGTSAGLTIVKKLVERHRGQVWPASTPGEGTTFFFTLSASNDHLPA